MKYKVHYLTLATPDIAIGIGRSIVHIELEDTGIISVVPIASHIGNVAGIEITVPSITK